jgi:hypothetical protein
MNISFPHLQDPLRIEIATGYLQHEFRKLLPRIRAASSWKQLDKEVTNLPNNPTMAPTRDFWNLIDGISFGLKLKNLVPLFT